MKIAILAIVSVLVCLVGCSSDDDLPTRPEPSTDINDYIEISRVGDLQQDSWVVDYDGVDCRHTRYYRTIEIELIDAVSNLVVESGYEANHFDPLTGVLEVRYFDSTVSVPDDELEDGEATLILSGIYDSLDTAQIPPLADLDVPTMTISCHEAGNTLQIDLETGIVVTGE